jgi:hypothetical protein
MPPQLVFPAQHPDFAFSPIANPLPDFVDQIICSVAHQAAFANPWPIQNEKPARVAARAFESNEV